MQAGPEAVYCHRRCADLELIDRLAVIRASVSGAVVLDALPDPRPRQRLTPAARTPAPGSVDEPRECARQLVP